MCIPPLRGPTGRINILNAESCHGRSADKREAILSVPPNLSNNKDSVIRYGAMYLIGSAYIGTGHNKALKQLLHFAVSDNDDNVRRAAVINIAFVLFKNYKQMPKMMNLLA